jgi:hypothetical protein
MTDKVNISSIVSSQFPGFVREDYEAFVAFVKAYYEFLQQDYSTDLKTIRDIDTTLDEYVKHFKSEYASNIPFILANERFVLSNIKDLNLAKGSEASYRLLFRLLFDKEIAIGYPGQQMLRASDGRWEQKVSIFVEKIKGNPDDIVNKTVDILSSTGVIKTLVYNYKDLQITIDGKEVYELSINRRFFGNIAVGDRVLLDGTFIARILPTISKLMITQAGKNFKVGELYSIGTTGTILKIVKTDNDGAILFAQIINYSMDQLYVDGFTYQLVSKTDEAKNLGISDFSVIVPGVIEDKDIGLEDATSGYTEFGSLNTYDYNIDSDPAGEAFPHNYAGNLLRTFSTSNIISTIDIGLLAFVEFELGAVSKYPGYYTANNGFLDDAMFIQDGRFYQIYSYIVRVDEKLEAYKAAVKTMIHPAGTALFGEYTITNEFDLSADLESMLKSLIIILRDTIAAADAKHFDVQKALGLAGSFSGLELAVPIESHIIHMDKPLTDSVTISELSEITPVNFNVDKLFEENTDPVVDAKDHFDVSKALAETQALSDTRILAVDKPLADSLTPADAKDHFAVDKPLTDSVTISEVSVITPLNFQFDKLFEDTTDPVVDAKDHFIISKVLTDVLDAQTDDDVMLFEKTLDGYDLITLSDNTILYLNGEALYYKYDTEVILDSGGQIWFDNYLDDMTLFENDGSNDYMVGKITF